MFYGVKNLYASQESSIFQKSPLQFFVLFEIMADIKFPFSKFMIIDSAVKLEPACIH